MKNKHNNPTRRHGIPTPEYFQRKAEDRAARRAMRLAEAIEHYRAMEDSEFMTTDAKRIKERDNFRDFIRLEFVASNGTEKTRPLTMNEILPGHDDNVTDIFHNTGDPNHLNAIIDDVKNIGHIAVVAPITKPVEVDVHVVHDDEPDTTVVA